MIRIVKGVVLTEEALALIKGKEDELSPDDELEPYMTKLGVIDDEGTRQLAMILLAESRRLCAEIEEVKRRAEDGGLTVKEARELAARYNNEATKNENLDGIFWTLVKDSLPADCNIAEYGAVGLSKGWVVYGVKKMYSGILSRLVGGRMEIIRI